MMPIINQNLSSAQLTGNNGIVGNSELISSDRVTSETIEVYPKNISNNGNNWEQLEEKVIAQPTDKFTDIPARFMELVIDGEKAIVSSQWSYRDEIGKLLCLVQRYDFRDGRKEFRPLTPSITNSGVEWKRKALDKPRPLYGLDILAARPNAEVIVCEGERAADAASRLFPQMVAVTSMNGAKSPKKSDWSKLKGRTIYLWPDFDQAGEDYISTVLMLSKKAGAKTLFMVNPQWFLQASIDLGIERHELIKGWDAADAEQEGFNAANIQLFLGRNITHESNLLFKLVPEHRLESKVSLDSKIIEKFEAPKAVLNKHSSSWFTNSEFAVFENRKGFKDGVYWQEQYSKDDEPIPPMFICSPLIILSDTRDSSQSNWGRLLYWQDKDRHEHIWACPAEFLAATDTAEFRREMLRNGLNIATHSKSRQKLVEYVINHPAQSQDRIRCVTKTGWYSSCYVLTNQVFGKKKGESLIYQGMANGDFSSAGDLDGWKREVASRAVGNSRIVFSISSAFAGPLVELANESGGGFQFTGTTSKGKTSTIIDPAASVFGHPDHFAKKWRTTANGLEALCLSRNHSTLILDDLGQSDAKECGQAAYLIANGQGKVRMQKEGGNHPLSTWKTLILSSGEVDITQHMAEAGKVARGGQVARLPSIPADAGSGMFSLEQLHDQPDGRQFSDTMKVVTREYYGTAGTSYLHQLTEPETLKNVSDSIRVDLTEIVESLCIPDGAAPEVGRVAARFALVAFAGELATKFGITGWEKGDSLKAADRCFNDWLTESGSAMGADDKTLFAQVSAFLQAHGASKFPPHDISCEDLLRVQNRAGFSYNTGEDIFYWVESGAFKSELCKGFNPTVAAKILIKAGWLEQGKDRIQQKKRISAVSGKNGLWFYVMTFSALGGEL